MAEVDGGGTPGGVRKLPDMSPEERAQWLFDNINSEISLPQWQAWANQVDPGCPSNHPFRTTKRVTGGNQNECVETPDNCPVGTRAFGQDQCLPENDGKFAAADGTGAGQEGGAAAPPQIGLEDLMSNMTYQRMFGGQGATQDTSTQNMFNIQGGNRARVLEGGALQWGAAPGFSSTDFGTPAVDPIYKMPTLPTEPTPGGGVPGLPQLPGMQAQGLTGLVHGMTTQRKRRTAPTFSY